MGSYGFRKELDHCTDGRNWSLNVMKKSSLDAIFFKEIPKFLSFFVSSCALLLVFVL